jgi:hypothetical protein
MSTITEKRLDEVLEKAEANLTKYLETLKYRTSKEALRLSNLLLDDAKEYSDASEKRFETFAHKYARSKWYNRWFYLLRCKQLAKKFMENFGRLCYLEKDIEKYKKIIEEYEKKYPNACEQENK